jgi:hypothetical protein
LFKSGLVVAIPSTKESRQVKPDDYKLENHQIVGSNYLHFPISSVKSISQSSTAPLPRNNPYPSKRQKNKSFIALTTTISVCSLIFVQIKE